MPATHNVISHNLIIFPFLLQDVWMTALCFPEIKKIAFH